MHDRTLERAYAECRAIAKREAKNFYYSFVALPRARRDAICAIYAFMRKADDLSDDESVSREERRIRLSAWLTDWHAASSGSETRDLVFIAVRDAIARFNIPLELLDELVAGTTMDLEQAEGEVDTYATFGDLYRYCYLVASVVGLVCIRIFGYKDPRAEKLAEETGVAFQLTNILRDVKEDAALGRVYLPREDFARFGLDVGVMTNGSPREALRPVLEFEALRARAYYSAADELLPLVNEDSRAALWTLVEIYRRLLERIIAGNYNVFGERVRLTTAEKLSVMARGFLRFT